MRDRALAGHTPQQPHERNPSMFWSMCEWIEQSPAHADGCEHGVGCYAGTIEVVEKTGHGVFRATTLDVYVHNKGKSVCIRYGSEPSEYLGVPLCMLAGIIGARDECPWTTGALRFLASKGLFRCVLPQPIVCDPQWERDRDCYDINAEYSPDT